MAFLRTLLAAAAAFVFPGTGQGRNIAAFDPVNIGSNISHSHPMQHSRSLLTVITMTNDSADSVCNNTATDGDEDRRNALGPVDIEIKEHRMTLLSILILCIGHILVWASSFTHSWSYSPSPVKNRPTKAFRKRFPGWKRRRWYPIALFLSSMCVPAQASQYSTIAVSIASRGDTGAASSNAVGVALTAAATAIGSGGGGADEAECTIEWCKDALNAIKTDLNEHVIDYIIEVILPQVKDARFIPVFIGLCPTPEMRGHESLGGKGRRDYNREKAALSIRLMKALSRCLPTREQGGIDSGNSDIPNAFWVNARETCTNNGETCKVCRSWRQYEANAIGQALCILSKCVKYYEGCIVAINVSGVSVNADYIFDYLREHGSFDGLCEYGTHISKLGCKCKAWSKSHQCNVASRTLAAIDDLLAPIYHKVNIEPPASFLRTGLENSLFKYVTPDGNVGSCSEKCAECCTADATKVDMLLLESLEVNDSSFNEGQEEEDDDSNECDNDGNKIALCMVCDECAQARVDKHDDSNDLSTQYMPLAEFRSEQKRAKQRERSAAWYAQIKEEGGEKYDELLAYRREYRREWYAQVKEEGGEKYDKLLEYGREWYAQVKEEGGEKYDKLLASKRASYQAKKRTRAEEKKESLDWEAHLQHTLKQVLDFSGTTAHGMWKMLSEHDEEKMQISFPTFQKWWDEFDSRTNPLKLGVVQVIESFCNSRGAIVVKIPIGEHHGLELQECQQQVIVNGVVPCSRLAKEIEKYDKLLASKRASYQAKKRTRAEEKKESLDWEAHLQQTLKQVLDFSGTTAHGMWKMLSEHDEEKMQISFPTFQKWWDEFDSRTNPLKLGVVQVIESFCNSRGAIVVKIPIGEHHGLELQECQQQVIVNGVVPCSRLAKEISPVVSIDAKNVEQMNVKDMETHLSENDRQRCVTVLDTSFETKPAEMQLPFSSNINEPSQKRMKPTETNEAVTELCNAVNKVSDRNAPPPPLPEAAEPTKSSPDSSSVVVTPTFTLEKISVPPIPEYVPPLPLCVGSRVTVDRNDEVPQPGHRVSIKRKWYTPYLGWLDEHGGTIKSTSEGEDGGMILHIVCDLLQMGELDVPYPHDQVTVNFNQPKFSTEHYWNDSRL